MSSAPSEPPFLPGQLESRPTLWAHVIACSLGHPHSGQLDTSARPRPTGRPAGFRFTELNLAVNLEPERNLNWPAETASIWLASGCTGSFQCACWLPPLISRKSTRANLSRRLFWLASLRALENTNLRAKNN